MKKLFPLILALLWVPCAFAQPAFLTTAESYHLPLYAFDSAGIALYPAESLFVVVYDQDGDSVYSAINDTSDAVCKGPYLRLVGETATVNEYTYFATVGTLDGTTGGVGFYRVEIMIWNSTENLSWRVSGGFYEVATNFNTTLARLDEVISTRSPVGDTIQREALPTSAPPSNWEFFSITAGGLITIADTTNLSKLTTQTEADIAALNNFDYTSEQVIVATNNDKTGYTASTVTDKTGYSLTQTFPANFADMAILVTTGEVGIDLDNTQGTISGSEIALTPTEFTPAYATLTITDAQMDSLIDIVRSAPVDSQSIFLRKLIVDATWTVGGVAGDTAISITGSTTYPGMNISAGATATTQPALKIDGTQRGMVVEGNVASGGAMEFVQNNGAGASVMYISSGSGQDYQVTSYAILADKGIRIDAPGDTALALITSGATGIGLHIDNETGDTSVTVHDRVNYTGNITVTNDIAGKIGLVDSLAYSVVYNALYNGLGGESSPGSVWLDPIGEFNKDTAFVLNAAKDDTLFKVIYIRNGGDGTPVDTIRFIRP